ncbi:MAG: hypothetical protein RLZZ142_1580 [Verrucomicrobiota bacterium]|jgi:hypothetical protein
MNPERLEHLLRQYFDADITDAETAELEVALQTRPEVRARFWKEAHLQGALREWGLEGRGARELQVLMPPPAPSRREKFLWRSWHPLAAAAAGIVFGIFCASVAWAAVSPRSAPPIARTVPLGENGFESIARRLPAGFPSKFGVWSGDPACTVADSSPPPRQGKQRLQLLQADREPALPNWGAHSCDVYQLVDLRPLKQAEWAGETSLELSVRFLDTRSAPGERISFRCRLHVFAGHPETISTEWPRSEREALASGSGASESLGGPNAIVHQLSTRILLPPKADFALIQLIAHKPTNPAGTVATFGSQYADDIQLTLYTPSTPAPRLSRK